MRKSMINFLSGKNSGGERGYTLIEMAVVISVAGLLLASFVSAYGIYLKTKAQQTTENNSSLLAAALSNFLVQNGRYPCPARMDLQRGDADYGMESECDPAVNAAMVPPPAVGQVLYPATVTAGTCAVGLCFEDGEWAVDVDPDPANDTAANCPGPSATCTAAGWSVPKIRRGAVPFRVLGIPEDQSEDGWGNRFQYALTENLAVVTSYVRTSGGISVQDSAGALLTPNDNRAHYLIFSAGPDKAGAYSHYGQLSSPCVTTTLDGENCNTGLPNPGDNPLAVYRLANFSTVEAANVTGACAPLSCHFDDYIKYYSSVETPLWQVAANGFDIRDLIRTENGNAVGINNPNPLVPLDVTGEVRADIDSSGTVGGLTKAAQLCDPSGSNCFPIGEFGDPAGASSFQCPAGTYAEGFAQLDAAHPDKYIRCVAETPRQCDPGSIMIGIDNAGKVQCEPVATCPDGGAVDVCGTSFQLTSQIQGYIHTFSAGNDRVQRYQCTVDPTNGAVWNLISATGVCVCTPVDTTTTQTCVAYMGTGANTFSGDVLTHYQHFCPSNTDSTSVDSSACLCTPTSQTQVVSCPSGLSGNRTRQRDWICDTATSGHWTSWTIVDDQCTCTPTVQTQTLSCPTAHTGIITQERTRQCPSGAWGSWTTTSNTCVCTGATQNDTQSCGANYTGSIQRHRDYNCLTLSWGSWIIDSNSCTCSGGTQTQTLSCPDPAHQTGQINQQRIFDCPTGTWGPWATTSDTCACVASVETRTTACTAPLAGNIYEQRTFDCTSYAWGPWTETGNNCSAVTYYWRAKTAQTGPFGAPLAITKDSTCPSVGATSSCSSAAGGGQYWHYSQCECE